MSIHRFPVYCLIAFSLAVVCACAIPGSYVNSSVNGVQQTYRYDEGGKKVLVYETDRTGKLTVHDPNDKRAQQMMSWQKGQQTAEAEKAGRMEKIKQAPKRKPADPIFVHVKPIDYSAVTLTDKERKDVHDNIKKYLADDKIIRFTFEEKPDEGKRSVKHALKDVRGKGENADVDVSIEITYEAGIGGRRGKLVEIKNLGLNATINSRWLGDTHKASAGCSLVDLSYGMKNFQERVKKVIVNDIGPTIPADRSL
jgi:hypothetical protein